ncbi:GFA family protein [Hoeflea sp. TYP-13]|uniref:GFA family protein n=1 Tax=Hoeflea sp. TYP-13 TaxID=3230023 RepID=UPI0034C69E36
MPKELKGSCLCGQIRYKILGPLVGVLNCHCSMCRKSHGAAFRTRAAVKRADFQYLEGENLLTRYQSSPGEHRTFCSVCGANIVTEFDADQEWLGFALGTLDDDPGVKPQRHIFVGSKAPWHDITDDLPQWQAMPDS